MSDILNAVTCLIIIVLRPYSFEFYSASMINFSLLFLYLELVLTVVQIQIKMVRLNP